MSITKDNIVVVLICDKTGKQQSSTVYINNPNEITVSSTTATVKDINKLDQMKLSVGKTPTFGGSRTYARKPKQRSKSKKRRLQI